MHHETSWEVAEVAITLYFTSRSWLRLIYVGFSITRFLARFRVHIRLTLVGLPLSSRTLKSCLGYGDQLDVFIRVS